jgi:hypothetical protein
LIWHRDPFPEDALEVGPMAGLGYHDNGRPVVIRRHDTAGAALLNSRMPDVAAMSSSAADALERTPASKQVRMLRLEWRQPLALARRITMPHLKFVTKP